MKDNLSIVITIIVLVLLMVIFPLYNFFERQDDMSYNLVLKATTNFADQVMNNGYIDQNTYDKFVTELANTGNVYDIEIEAHRKVLTNSDDPNVYEEQSYIDYSDDIFVAIDTTNTANLMKKSLKNNIYFFNPKDEIYVKVKNSNMTMAGSLFNTIVPASKKERIQINYGGIIKNNAWKDVDATYTGHNMAPGTPVIYLGTSSEITGTRDNPFKVSKNDIVNLGITAKSTAFEGSTISKYLWKITDMENTSNVQSYNGGINGKLGDVTFEDGHKYTIEVNAVDNRGYSSDHKVVYIEITNTGTPVIETDILGDLNNDSILNSEDVVILNEYINGSRTFSATEKKKADINNSSVVDKRDLDYLRELVENGYILGDVNNDNNVSINDVSLVQEYIAKLITFDDEKLKRADMNKDGSVNNEDVSLIQNKGLGK